MDVKGIHGHTIAGLFYFDVPVTLALCFLFHQVARQPLIDNLPAYFQRKCSPSSFAAMFRKEPLTVAVSALIGAVTHVFWDGFTHGDGFFVKRLSFYDGSFVHLDGVNYPLWYALQHISTFAGLFVCGLYVLLLPMQNVDPARPSTKYWLMTITVTAAVTLLRFMIGEQFNLGIFVVSTITGFCVALLLSGYAFRRVPTKA